MIITRTPFRVSFAGGGSDIASFYERHGGCVLSTTINKYVYISVHPSFSSKETTLKYSKTETVKNVSEIEHVYFRTVLEELKVRGVEIVSTADVPAGTGLGSSSAFIVGLLHALYSYKGKFVSKERLAREACEFEIDKLGNPIGKQDQYAAAYGGINYIEFKKDGSVFVEPLIMKESSRKTLEENLMMLYTGRLHNASAILREQSGNMKDRDKEASQLKICELAKQLRDEFQNNNVGALGEILHENWLLKKTLVSEISNPEIDEMYEKARASGAVGGKLLGAGGGGFLLLYVPKDRQAGVKSATGLPQLPISFDRQGSAIVFVGDKPDLI